MKFLKLQDGKDKVHIIPAYKVIDFKVIDKNVTELILDFPLQDLTFEVHRDAEELIEKIYGTDDADDIYEIIDCLPLESGDVGDLISR